MQWTKGFSLLVLVVAVSSRRVVKHQFDTTTRSGERESEKVDSKDSVEGDSEFAGHSRSPLPKDMNKDAVALAEMNKTIKTHSASRIKVGADEEATTVLGSTGEYRRIGASLEKPPTCPEWTPFMCFDEDCVRVAKDDRAQPEPWETCKTTETCNTVHRVTGIEGLRLRTKNGGSSFQPDLGNPKEPKLQLYRLDETHQARKCANLAKLGGIEPSMVGAGRRFKWLISPDQKFAMEFKVDEEQLLLENVVQKVKCACGSKGQHHLWASLQASKRAVNKSAPGTKRLMTAMTRPHESGCYNLKETWRLASITIQDGGVAGLAGFTEAAERKLEEAVKRSEEANKIRDDLLVQEQSARDFLKRSQEDTARLQGEASKAAADAKAKEDASWNAYLWSYVQADPEAQRAKQAALDAGNLNETYKGVLEDLQTKLSKAVEDATMAAKKITLHSGELSQHKHLAQENLWQCDFAREKGALGHWTDTDSWTVKHVSPKGPEEAVHKPFLESDIFKKSLLYVTSIEMTLKKREGVWEDVCHPNICPLPPA